MAWNDAPPTQEEMSKISLPEKWDSAPPSATEMAEVSPSAATSPVTAATTGLANGASLGWAPAIGAATKTGMDAIVGTNGPLAGGSLSDLVDEYHRQRDELESRFAKAAAAHPKIAAAANLAGGATSLGLAGPAAMTPGGLAASGAIQGAGGVDVNSAADLPKAALAAGQGAGMNMAAGKVAETAAPLIGKALAPVGNAISSGIKGVGGWIGDHAADLAEKATGATGAEAAKFKPGTGRALLDTGTVGFGSSPADIAQNAGVAMDKSGDGISSTLGKLEGTKVDRNSVLKYIQDKIDSLAGDDSQTDLVKKLEGAQENIKSQIPGDATEVAASDASEATPSSEIPIDQAEQIKRGYQGKVNWKSPNPDVVSNNANTTVSDAYRQSVEDAAVQADPALGEQFKADKETYGLMSPVKKAAERRSFQLQQSPHGGLLDMAAAGAGAAAGGPLGAVAGLATKQLRPRFAAAGAVSADQLSKVVSATPEAFGRFASVLKSAAARGATSLGATDYILQQTDPEYRSQRNKAFGSPDEEQEPWMLSQAEDQK